MNFFEFAESAIEPFLKDGKIGTYDKNKAVIAKLKNFANAATLTFQDITPEFLTKYQNYLKNTLNNKTNTANNSFKFISQMFKLAYNQDLIDHKIIPFNKFKIKSEKTQRAYLSEDELNLIENYQPTPGTRLELHRDMFVFSSYTGGIRISDILQLKRKDFDGTNLNITMQKTGGQISVKVPNKALAIIEKYTKPDGNTNDYIFPMLANDLDAKNPRVLDNALSSATAYINKNLKLIATKLNLDKPLSFHISRHTWATRALRKGISIDKVSKLMGHANIRETQIYAKIVSSELDKAMDVFND
ncbi:tyrosine-type recombinase/integrase [Parasediminibacterium sp. JCM 36343]|uniref:tyrosine-type recombinase/integrase n=1 Tax=Parasediminibacterium sp. JCM 36343 TaxID=3374279 RepID=UPI00397CBD50